MRPPQSGKRRFLAALHGGPVDRIPVGNAVSVATTGLMEACGASFPEAHRDPAAMARLAEAGHAVLGYDTVMPVFSVTQEAAALGCGVDWGAPLRMPAVRERPWAPDAADLRIPRDWSDAPSIRTVLEAVRLLRGNLGDRVAVIGKAMGPWSLSYSLWGTEEFLAMTLLDPEKARRSLQILKEVTVRFANAQAQAGADAVCIADHATDMISPAMYRDMLLPVHQEILGRVGCPVILHCCGDTSDRIGLFAEAGFDCFHFESKVDPRAAVAAAGPRMRLMGNVNNPRLLLRGSVPEILEACRKAAEAGVRILAPECAVPLDTPTENLKALVLAAERNLP